MNETLEHFRVFPALAIIRHSYPGAAQHIGLKEASKLEIIVLLNLAKGVDVGVTITTLDRK